MFRLLLAGLVCAFLPLAARGAAADDAISAARRGVEMAEIRMRLYERDEYPQQLHRLDRQIALAKARCESGRRRVAEYEQFDKFKYSGPLFTSLEDARLAVVEFELQTRELEESRVLLEQSHADRRRLMQLELDDANARLRALLLR
ncbi:MAG: hypothetical protein KDA41_18760 [Planctomycetales bacterium]|nr:hypothetical protein [Planctomycetales bacterium]